MDTLLSEDNGDALNVIIPLGGIGSRFAKMGYRFPKVSPCETTVVSHLTTLAPSGLLTRL